MQSVRVILAVSICLVYTTLLAAQPVALKQSFMMRQTEDGKPIADSFEIWTITGEFGGPNARCIIQVASFYWLDNLTHVFNWMHISKHISEIQPAVFKLEMTGRLNPFSGLEVVLELSSDRKSIVNISASMRAGTKGQSVSIFQIDRDSENRKIPPVYNPSWSPKRD